VGEGVRASSEGTEDASWNSSVVSDPGVDLAAGGLLLDAPEPPCSLWSSWIATFIQLSWMGIFVPHGQGVFLSRQVTHFANAVGAKLIWGRQGTYGTGRNRLFLYFTHLAHSSWRRAVNALGHWAKLEPRTHLKHILPKHLLAGCQKNQRLVWGCFFIFALEFKVPCLGPRSDSSAGRTGLDLPRRPTHRPSTPGTSLQS
jgi:hypothetical protein